MPSTEAEVTVTVYTLASFVCVTYSPKGIYIKSISKLWWHLLCKHMAESDKLPPTLDALRQHVLIIHIQWLPCRRNPMAIWNQPWQTPFQLHRPSLRWLAVNAKQTVLTKNFFRTKNLSCTDLCPCVSDCQNDDHTQNNYETDDDDDVDDV